MGIESYNDRMVARKRLHGAVSGVLGAPDCTASCDSSEAVGLGAGETDGAATVVGAEVASLAAVVVGAAVGVTFAAIVGVAVGDGEAVGVIVGVGEIAAAARGDSTGDGDAICAGGFIDAGPRTSTRISVPVTSLQAR